MKSSEYIDVLEGAAILEASSEFGLAFMDDNALIHRAHIVQEWKTHNGVGSLHWPTYSPDLNPIKNIWGLIKNKIHSSASYGLNERIQLFGGCS
jgi:transposase